MELVAVLGTIISPYLFFWQLALEVENPTRRKAVQLCLDPPSAKAEFARIAASGRIMGRLTISRSMLAGGWIATALMLAASIGFFLL